MGWRDRARCGRMDRDLAERIFFGAENGHLYPPEVRYARAVCEGCPVRPECLSEALSVPETYDRVGIVAGLLPRERRALRVQWRITPKSGEWHGGRVGDVRSP